MSRPHGLKGKRIQQRAKHKSAAGLVPRFLLLARAITAQRLTVRCVGCAFGLSEPSMKREVLPGCLPWRCRDEKDR